MHPRDSRKTIGLARIIGEYPLSTGEAALEITNFSGTDKGILESGLRVMPLVPHAWRAPPAEQTVFQNGVRAMCFGLFYGEVPEILFLAYDKNSPSAQGSVWRFTPWNRATGGANPALVVQRQYDDLGNSQPVVMQALGQYAPQMVAAGNRIYMSFCDGGSLWVWDREKVRPMGYSNKPSAPSAEGPSRLGTNPNMGGFSVRGRIGNTDGDWTDNIAGSVVTVGGIDAGTWRYAVVWENVDGAYSPASDLGGMAQLSIQVSNPAAPGQLTENLRRKFRVTDIPKGPYGTVARVLLRTPNLERLPLGVSGTPQFLHRIPNNLADEWVDDIPDGELGAPWEDREPFPLGAYFLREHAGSMFYLRTDGAPFDIWWSEQTAYGPIYESIMAGHRMPVFPQTGPITGAWSARAVVESALPTLLIFKEGAVHFLTGAYPSWQLGTLHQAAGLAGPGLVQSVSDGSVIWYGSRTFWMLGPDGKVTDIGAPIRCTLRKVNHTRARYGVSWITPVRGEAVFALPLDDSETNNFWFVWDPQEKGWRFMRLGMTVDAALTIPGSDAVVVSGKLGNSPGVWLYDKGHPGFTVSQPLAIYQTGWLCMRDLGPDMHDLHNVNDLVFTLEERGEGQAGLLVYADWNLDTPTTNLPSPDGVHLAHPELASSCYYDLAGLPAADPASYGIDSWRSSRVYTTRSAVHAVSLEAFSVRLEATDPLAIISIDAYGPFVAMPGGRTPQPAE